MSNSRNSEYGGKPDYRKEGQNNKKKFEGSDLNIEGVDLNDLPSIEGGSGLDNIPEDSNPKKAKKEDMEKDNPNLDKEGKEVESVQSRVEPENIQGNEKEPNDDGLISLEIKEGDPDKHARFVGFHEDGKVVLINNVPENFSFDPEKRYNVKLGQLVRSGKAYHGEIVEEQATPEEKNTPAVDAGWGKSADEIKEESKKQFEEFDKWLEGLEQKRIEQIESLKQDNLSDNLTKLRDIKTIKELAKFFPDEEIVKKISKSKASSKASGKKDAELLDELREIAKGKFEAIEEKKDAEAQEKKEIAQRVQKEAIYILSKSVQLPDGDQEKNHLEKIWKGMLEASILRGENPLLDEDVKEILENLKKEENSEKEKTRVEKGKKEEAEAEASRKEEKLEATLDGIFENGQRIIRDTSDKLYLVYSEKVPIANLLTLVANSPEGSAFRDEIEVLIKSGELILEEKEGQIEIKSATEDPKNYDDISRRAREILEDQNRTESLDRTALDLRARERIEKTDLGGKMAAYLTEAESRREQNRLIARGGLKGRWDKLNYLFSEKSSKFNEAEMDIEKMETLYQIWSAHEREYIGKEYDFQRKMREIMADSPDGQIDSKTNKKLQYELASMSKARGFIDKKLAEKIIFKGGFDLEVKQEEPFEGVDYEKILEDQAYKDKIIRGSDLDSLLNASKLNEDNIYRFRIGQSESGDSIGILAKTLARKEQLRQALDSRIFKNDTFNATHLYGILSQMKENSNDVGSAEQGVKRQIRIAERVQFREEAKQDRIKRIKEKFGEIMGADKFGELEIKYNTEWQAIIDAGSNKIALKIKKRQEEREITQKIRTEKTIKRAERKYSFFDWLNNVLPEKLVSLEIRKNELNKEISNSSAKRDVLEEIIKKHQRDKENIERRINDRNNVDTINKNKEEK